MALGCDEHCQDTLLHQMEPVDASPAPSGASANIDAMRGGAAQQTTGHRRSLAVRDLADMGLDRRRLGADMVKPYHGIRAVGLPLDATVTRCLALLPMLQPGQCFSHTTALELLGGPVVERPSRTHIAVRHPRTPPRGVGVLGHSLREMSVTMHLGMPVSTPEHAWCQAASVLDDDALVISGDALLTGARVNGIRGPGITTIERLTAAVELHRGCAGAGRMRNALRLVRTGVDSPGETRLRLLIRRAGYPEPAVDVPIRCGDRVLHADLGYPDRRIAIEYEGDWHRTSRSQWHRDIERAELIQNEGWRRMRFTSQMVEQGQAAVMAILGPVLRQRRRL